jgi:type IV pilus assembly protein PilW
LELLITMVLGIIVVGAVIHIFLAGKQSARLQEALARIQENGRQALRVVDSDVRMARYLGQTHEYWSVTAAANPRALPTSVAGECFTTAALPYRWLNPFSVSVDHDGQATTPTVFAPRLAGSNDSIGPFTGCIAAANYQQGSDVLTVHYADAKPIDTHALQRDGLYVRSDLNHAEVFRCHNAPGCQPGGSWDALTDSTSALIASVFYVRRCSNPGDDATCGTRDDLDQPNVPALVRVRVGADGAISSDAIAEGVVNFQVQYGVDDDDVGYPQRYLDANEIGALSDTSAWPLWQRVRTVRIWALVRSSIAEGDYSGPTTFAMGDHRGDAAVTTPNGYRHQLFSTTIALRNFAG